MTSGVSAGIVRDAPHSSTNMALSLGATINPLVLRPAIKSHLATSDVSVKPVPML